jgi:hypothetical protein
MRLRRSLRVTILTSIIFLPDEAQSASVTTGVPAPVDEPASVPFWPSGTSAFGTRGIYRTEAAISQPAGDFILMVSGQYSRATDLFTKGDTNERHLQHVSFVWVPLRHLELGLTYSTVSNRNPGTSEERFEPATTQSIGDPVLAIKYTFPITAELGITGGVRCMIPTSAKGTGLDPKAFSLIGYVAASYLATSWLGLHLNAGYRLDNSAEVFNRDLSPIHRFTAGINEENTVIARVGADTFFRVRDRMAIGPFSEVSSAMAPEIKESPTRVSVGIKWFPFGEGAVEVAAGGDFAITGTPEAGSKMAGIPPWEVFGSVLAHLNPPKSEPGFSAPRRCTSDTQCAPGQGCIDGLCAMVREVVKEKEVVTEVPIPTFIIQGGVLDQSSSDPVGNATVSFSGVKGSALAVDYRTGTFLSWPLPVGEGLVKVTASAPGYRTAEQTIPKGKSGEVKELTFEIQALGAAVTGEIRGNLKDARNGRPIRNGQVFIPVLNQRIRSDREGRFRATVKAGRYQVLISGRQHITQKKEIEIRAGDVVILNVDMNPKR